LATLDDILTTQKNGVVAINNLSQSLGSFYTSYVYLSGDTTSGSITSTTAQTAARGSGRFVSYTTAATAGSTAGLIYDSVSFATTSATGTGSIATVGYAGVNAFKINDRVAIYNMTPAGYNVTTATVTAVDTTNNTFSYSNATTAAQTIAGIVFKIYDYTTDRNLLLSSLNGTLGTYPINVNFTYGLVAIPAASQFVNITYSLS
jgi:hypothetical protein